jgi:hypothetical protein
MAETEIINFLKQHAGPDAPIVRAWSVDDFARIHGIGRTTAYAEIKEGRLTARRVKGRTIITDEDAAAWRKNLPKVHESSAA